MKLDLSRFSSIGDALRDATSRSRDHVAFIEADRDRENGRWTFAEFQRETERFASWLQSIGCKPNDRCAILMSNQSKWVFSAAAAFWSGLTLVPLDYKLTPGEQAALLRHAKPSVLITEWPIFNRLGADMPPMHVIVTEAPPDAWLNGASRWETVKGDRFEYRAAAREDVACIVYSSGTGGTPKGCMLTHANYLSQAEQLGSMYPMKPGERFFSILPTNHAIDFMCGFIIPMLCGGTVVHQRTLRPEFLAATMKKYGITHMAMVPMILKAVEKKIRENIALLSPLKRRALDALIGVNAFATRRRPRHRLSRMLLKPLHEPFGGKLRIIIAGGAFVDPTTADFFYRIGIPVVIGYGLTEAGTALTVNDLRPFRSDTVGKPVTGIELDIREKNGEGIGEIWVRGPSVMKGYLDEPELTDETIVDGWLRTGDLGFVDDSGHVRLVGRAKNMIVTDGGKNIYPEDIETVFDGLEGTYEQSVFAANYIWPEAGFTGDKLVVVVRPREGVTSDALVAHVRERNRQLADFKRVTGYVVWPREFPRTASLKIKRGILARELAQALPRSDAVRII
ncbi:MAG: AMP-binding protein [Pseudomonadota bacterium]